MDNTVQPNPLDVILGELRSLRAENLVLQRSLAENREESSEFRLKLQAMEAVVHERVINATPPTSGPSASTQVEPNATPVVNLPTASDTSTPRPRFRLPDLALYEGSKSSWRAWKLEMENKLGEDAAAFGSKKSQFKYVYSRLTGKAKDNVTTFVEMETKKPEADPASILWRLDLLYGDRDRKQKAIQALYTIKQGDFESFSSFYPRLERELANADAEAWHDDSKSSYLRNALNDKMKQALVVVSKAEISTYAGLATKCVELSNSMELLGQWKKPSGTKSHQRRTPSPDHSGNRSQSATKREDLMEWEPTSQDSTQVNAVQPSRNLNGYPSKRPQDKALLGKRAKWVEKEEIEARRRDRRCLRCGRDDCRVQTCPLAAPIRPSSRTQVGVTTVRPRVTEASVEVEDEDSSGEEL
jgi:hypothetical protein